MTRMLGLVLLTLAGCAHAEPRHEARFRVEVPAPRHAMRVTSVPPSSGRSARVLEDGRVLYDGAEPTNDPEVQRVVLSPSWRLELHRTGRPVETLVTLDPATGALSPFGADPDWDTPAHIHCALQPQRSARCTSSWGHTPPLDVLFRVVGGEVVARAGPDGDDAPVARVSPAPRNDAEAYAALFVWVALQAASDDHGDDAHDID